MAPRDYIRQKFEFNFQPSDYEGQEDIGFENIDSDSDAEDAHHAHRPNTPVPVVWDDLGLGVRIVRDFLPQQYEQYFRDQIAHFTTHSHWLVDLPEPEGLTGAEESQLAAEFYSQGLLYYGQPLAPELLDRANSFFFFHQMEDLFRQHRPESFIEDRLERASQLVVAWSREQPDEVRISWNEDEPGNEPAQPEDQHG